MLEKKISLLYLGLHLLTGCVQKTHYIPSKRFYNEGESFQQTCETASNKLKINLPDVCTNSNADNTSFTCNNTTIEYDSILRLVLTDNDIGEDVLYISIREEEYALTTNFIQNPLLEISDALNILKNCRR